MRVLNKLQLMKRCYRTSTGKNIAISRLYIWDWKHSYTWEEWNRGFKIVSRLQDIHHRNCQRFSCCL